MYKPQTIEQFKIHQFLQENFAMEHFLLSPLSRSSLLLEDKNGIQIAFTFQDDCIHEITVPPPADPELIRDFCRRFRKLASRPILNDFDKLTRWWLDNPNPLTYQQALGLSDELYRHFLSRPLIDDEAARRLALKGLVTEDEYKDLELWYFNGNASSCWLGPLGLDGTGSIYGLTFHYGTPNAKRLQFYLLDEYYRFMNHLPK